MVLGILNLNSDTFVAFGAITSLAIFSILFSYVVILVILINVRFTTGIEKSQFDLGRWGLPLNLYALIHTLYVMIWLPFPTDVPVTAGTMNYNLPIFAGVMIGAVGTWFFWAKKHWLGPNLAIVEHVLRDESKE